MALAVGGAGGVAAATGHPWNRSAVAFGLGVAVASTVWIMIGAIVAFDGSLPARLRGRAERWTAAELDRLPLGWQVTHHVPYWLAGRGIEWDLDHVAVEPAGLVVIDTKWKSGGWAGRSTRDAASLAARRLSANAERLAKEVRHRTGPLPVTAVVAVWGPDRDRAAEGHTDGVAVVAGDDLAAWLAALPDAHIGPDTVTAATAVLAERIANHERWGSGRCEPHRTARPTASIPAAR